MTQPIPIDERLPWEALMRCERCDQAGRVSVRRAKTAKREGRVAVVLGVPMEECPACGEPWLAWDVATRLDEMLNAMIAGDFDVATGRYNQPDDRTAASSRRSARGSTPSGDVRAIDRARVASVGDP